MPEPRTTPAPERPAGRGRPAPPEPARYTDDGVLELRALEFPGLDDAAVGAGGTTGAIFLDAASSGPLPLRSLRAIEDVNRCRQDPRRLRDLDVPAMLDRARAAAARLIGAGPEEIALTPNTQVGLNLAAGFLLQRLAPGGAGAPRRRIVLSEGEFPANVHPWRALQAHGALLERVPADELGRPREDALLAALEQPDVALLAISAVQFASGWRADLARLGRIARERDILFVVDAIQALGALPLDARAAGIDVLSCGGQKWLCGPWGSGFAYVRRELLARFEPLFPGWLSFTTSADFTSLLQHGHTLLPDARRFEMATIAAQDAIGLALGIELLLELGSDRGWAHIRRVQQPLLAWLSERQDVVPVSDAGAERRSGILSFRPPGPERIFERLRRGGVVCGLREGAIRLSPHVYNTVAEMERVVDLLQEALAP